MIYHIPTYSDAFNFEVTLVIVKWEGRSAGFSSDATIVLKRYHLYSQ